MDLHERNVARLATRLRERLIERRRAEAASGQPTEEGIESSVRTIVEEHAAVLPAAGREEVVARVIRDSVGLGPLEVLLADPRVEEVMVHQIDGGEVGKESLVKATVG